MKKITRKQRIITLVIVLTLFAGTSIYLLLPYINNWRSQYSYKLELLGDNHPDEALSFYRKAELIHPSESLSLKIGTLYGNSDKLDLAERYFNKIKSENITLELANHYLKAGSTDKARSLLRDVPYSDDYIYYNALILALDSPQRALETIPETTDKKLLAIQTLLNSLLDNINIEYTDTAIALYLYNNGYINLALSKLESHNDSTYRDLHLLLGDIYSSLGLYIKAAIAYENARTIDPYNIHTYSELISTYKKLGDQDKIDEHSKALEALIIRN